MSRGTSINDNYDPPVKKLELDDALRSDTSVPKRSTWKRFIDRWLRKVTPE